MESLLVIISVILLTLLFLFLIIYHNVSKCPHCNRYFLTYRIVRKYRRIISDRGITCYWVYYYCPHCKGIMEKRNLTIENIENI